MVEKLLQSLNTKKLYSVALKTTLLIIQSRLRLCPLKNFLWNETVQNLGIYAAVGRGGEAPLEYLRHKKIKETNVAVPLHWLLLAEDPSLVRSPLIVPSLVDLAQIHPYETQRNPNR